VTLVEYGDHECPYCGQAEVVIRELLASFGDELRYVWRHLPLNPFHVCRLASRATDQVRRDEWNAHERSHTPAGRWVKGTRWSLLKAPERQGVRQLATLREVQHANRRLYRVFLLREDLRLLYHLDDRRLAPAHLDAWLAWAARSRLRPPVALARTLRAHCHGILAAIRLGLSNGRLEGLNTQDPADQPPQLRLPLRRRADRPRVPVLRRRRHRAASMNFTHNSTGAPNSAPKPAQPSSSSTTSSKTRKRAAGTASTYLLLERFRAMTTAG